MDNMQSKTNNTNRPKNTDNTAKPIYASKTSNADVTYNTGKTDSEHTNTPSKPRLFYIDNIRIYLTVLVILHHATLAYGGAGDWGIADKITDEISPILLTFFNALNQSYFMSAFFLLAGYFTPRSLEKKGSKSFLIDRFVRLGIPIVIYTTFIINVNAYILSVLARGNPYQIQVEYDPGHLWFLQALLLFAGAYVIFRILRKTPNSDCTHDPIKEKRHYYMNAFPPDKVLFISIGVLTVLTFMVRLVFPVGALLFSAQPAHFVHYIFCFCIGILAYHGNWFDYLTKAQGRRWGFMSLAFMPLFIPLFVLGGVLENEANVEKFFGGFYWQAFSYALWETFLMIGITTFILYYFREKFNRTSPFLAKIAASVFTVYIIHQTLLFAIQTLMLRASIPSISKFFIVSLIAVPLCFALAVFIRKIPYLKRVVG